MKEFNEENIKKRSNLEENDSVSTYMGHGAQQNPHAFEVFYNFLKEIKPTRILEIGTGMGGFTMSLKLHIEDLELNTDLRTYDVNGSFMHNTLLENGIDARLEDIFSKENEGKFKEVVEYIQSEGVTVVLCDGGNKIFEFRLLSEFIKTGDFIMAHDYAPNESYFQEYVDKKLWNWLEIKDSDIEMSVNEYNLEPYMKDEFQKAVWVCKRKR
jgi:hypothetical protein